LGLFLRVSAARLATPLGNAPLIQTPSPRDGAGYPGGSGCSEHVQAEHCSELVGAAQFELPQPAPLFDPAKHLLNPAAGDVRLGTALVAGGAAINGRATRSVVDLGHVQRNHDPPEFSDHARGVVVLAGTQRFLVGTREVSCHRFGGIPLSGAHRLRDPAIDDQGMAVVLEHMHPVARLVGVSIELACQQRVRIGCRQWIWLLSLMPRKSPLARFLPALN
jgi:hypothetical protein